MVATPCFSACQTSILIFSFQVTSEILRGNLERIVGRDDSAFSGIDLAALIRNKYGRSYDVQLIKKVLAFVCLTSLFSPSQKE